jgi:hypothetical protein
MVNFSIMLLMSRLVPFSFFAIQDSKKYQIDDKFTATITQIITSVKQQSGNSTYFVRKIAA